MGLLRRIGKVDSSSIVIVLVYTLGLWEVGNEADKMALLGSAVTNLWEVSQECKSSKGTPGERTPQGVGKCNPELRNRVGEVRSCRAQGSQGGLR